MRALIAAGAALALATCGQQAALAATTLSPGVHVDPGSPAGKEYQIPILAARSETSGVPPGSASEAAPPLFGVGVGAAPAVSPAARPVGPGRAPRMPRSAAAQPLPAGPLPDAIRLSASSGVGSHTWLALVAGAALVLVLGGGGGLALRRGLSRP